MLSPISETDSNKYNTLDSHGQTVANLDPAKERKLTGTGTYKLDVNPVNSGNGPAIAVK